MFLAIGLLSASAFGDLGIYGTRAGGGSAIDSSVGSPVGIGSIIQVALVLGIVLGAVRWLLPKVVSKMNTRLLTNLGGEIKIQDSASFAGGNLYIVQARHKTLLLSVATSGVTCLADLTRDETTSAPASTFDEVLRNAEPMVVAARPATTKQDVDDTLERLERLDRLANL